MAEHLSPKEMGLHAASGDCPLTVHDWTRDCVTDEYLKYSFYLYVLVSFSSVFYVK